MAISKEIWEQAKALFMRGDSLSKIAKETGISRGAIGKKSQKELWKKETITTLANDEVQNIINADKIKRQKETLNATERDTYNKVLLDKLEMANLATNTSIEIMKLLHAQATKGTKEIVIKDGHGMGATSHTKIDVDLTPTDAKDLAIAFKTITGGLDATETEDKPKSITFRRITNDQ